MRRKNQEEMKMLKRKYEEIGHKNSYGHGKKWFRGPKIVQRESSGSVFLATLKKPKLRFDEFPAQMAVKSAEMTVSAALQREKLVLDNLQESSCKYIVKCYGEELTTSESGDQEIYNLLLEYGSGGTLADLVKKHRHTGLPEFEVRRFTKCILSALLCTHEHGYVLRNLYPKNIILIPKNYSTGKVEYIAKLSNFGSVEEVEAIKEMRQLRGAVKYLSPEAVIDEMQLPPSDIWALGCIVIEMLTGKSIWGARIKDYQVEYNLRRMGSGKSSISITKLGKFSKEALSFLSRCLEMNPRDRLSAKELLLEPFVDGISLDDEDGLLEKVTGGIHFKLNMENDLDGYSCEERNSNEEKEKEKDCFRRLNKIIRNCESLCLV